MGRAPHNGRKEQMRVKSFRLSESDINILKVFQDAEDIPQSDALRTLLQYGIQYYTMYVQDEKSED